METYCNKEFIGFEQTTPNLRHTYSSLTVRSAISAHTKHVQMYTNTLSTIRTNCAGKCKLAQYICGIASFTSVYIKRRWTDCPTGGTGCSVALVLTCDSSHGESIAFVVVDHCDSPGHALGHTYCCERGATNNATSWHCHLSHGWASGCGSGRRCRRGNGHALPYSR